MDDFAELYKSRTVSLDLFDILLGKKIGNGAGREVYEHRLDSSLVVKVENSAGSFQNIVESKIWWEVSDSPYAKWFAPVVAISANGAVLVMKKAEPARKHEYPKKIPAFFTDLKRQNFGLLNGKFVCVDYGSSILSYGFTKKLKQAKWWSEDHEDIKR